MFSDALNLKTEQIPRNRLWRHSITIEPTEKPEEVAELLEALIEGLLDDEDDVLYPYMVVSEGAVDRRFFEAIENAECPRFPLAGTFGRSEGAHWTNRPFVFRIADPGLIGTYVARFWGKGAFAVFFSSLEPIEFFSMIRAFGVVRREGGSLIWAPFWFARSFEKFLTDSDARRTKTVFRKIAYYLAEGEDGSVVRVYCRGEEGAP
ncbi:MAG: hypothetical protein ABIH26_06065 [Candidatus Eisenbacteria bacterium]